MVNTKLHPSSSLPSADSFFPQLPFHREMSLCFLHLEKTSGTTIRLIVENAFEGSQTFPSGSRAYDGSYIGIQTALEAGDDLGRFCMLSGHFGPQIIGHLETKANLFTWLREPRDRLISEFFFRFVQQRFVHFSTFVLRLDRGERLETVFIDWLRSLVSSHRHHWLQYALVRQENVRHRSRVNGRNTYSQSSLAEAASDVIRRCFFFGLMEDQECSVDALCALTSILPPKFTEKRNAGTKRTHRLNLTPSELVEFDQKIAADMAFYGLMKNVYCRQIAALRELAPTNPALSYIGDREGLRSYLLKLHGTRAKVLTSWSAWDPVLGENLDTREQFKSADGSVHRWRWTSPNPDTYLYFRLPRNFAFDLRIKLNPATPLKNVEKTLVRVAGKQVVTKLTAAENGRTDLLVSVGDLLSKHLPNLDEIHLHSSEMLDESKIVPYVGTRMLGLAIESISVEHSSADQ